ncbi:CRAL-TRIO domain-containing protein [Dactylonectria estremocensis]|uniref:CRAL-TRIO domain-containing protein n=1 Tax=Dactylonectria estremocensis TaxID=1079267 RepID=A0A9P9E2H3_9HYPO|nr:CRAL-TRIO domain-containing protein [Dactylonectria estremocensis]
MSHLSEPGTLGNLTVEEERSLQEAWVHLLRLCGTQCISHDAPDKSHEFLQHVNNQSPEEFKQGLWGSILADHPDVAILRFLRARNWDVVKAVNMLASAINWRDERRINTDIIGQGESVGLKQTQTADEEAFIAQYRSGKSYVRGTDKDNHPIYIIKVRLHDPHKQSAAAMETYVLHNIEMLRIMARDAHDKVCLIFDLSGFGLRNMDFHVVKFLIQILEARYPETLGVVLVHNAPFVFWGIWNVIKHWLDPIIASKIHFTSGNKGLSKFISKDNLQKCYGGDDAWEYKFIDPVPSENLRMQSEEKKVKIQAERDELTDQFHRLTAEWVSLEPEFVLGKEKNAERDELVRQLQLGYWKLDPYVRATTYYHRVGVINRQGDVDFKAAK